MIDIQTFFEQSQGKWFTQRTRYNLAQKKVENGKAELTVELLPSDDRAIVELYEEASSSFNDSLDPLASAKISWDSDAEKGSNLLLFLSDPDKHQGRLIQKRMNSDQSAVIGQFAIAEDEALTLSTQTLDNRLLKERVWFAHPNLRLRTLWEENSAGHQGWVMFYSEIRRMNN